MASHQQTRQYYQANADELVQRYSAARPGYLDQIISLLRPVQTELGPDSPSLLDVGCGSGRDVAVLRQAGINASGVDPSPELIKAGTAHHHLPAHCLQTGSLPELAEVKQQYQAVLCAAALQHIPDQELLDSLYQLQQRVASGGFLLLSVPKNYPTDTTGCDQYGRLFRIRSPEQYSFFLERLGLRRIISYQQDDALGREDINWQVMLFSRESDRTDITPLRPIETIESLLWDDRKVNSYKFALLRALSHLASHRPQLAHWHAEERVSVPLDAIADLWIEYYWPIVFPPHGHTVLQGQSGKKADMAFREPLHRLANYWQQTGGYPAFRIARQSRILDTDAARLYREARAKILTAIRQPVRYAGNQRTGTRIFHAEDRNVFLPAEIWRELALLGRWVEDSILIRWADFSAGLQQQDPDNTAGRILSLLIQNIGDSRETDIARRIYQDTLQHYGLRCVWTNTKLTDRFDVDHAIPWALWRNNDLWNLLPAHHDVNNKKRAKIPDRRLIISRRPAITGYWDILYEHQPRLFLAHAAAFTGTTPDTQFTNQLRDTLFTAFKDAMEFTAVNRGIERWMP
ncbi:methyltransferase domain-containing protein [Spirochaeta dissipatitropha]